MNLRVRCLNSKAAVNVRFSGKSGKPREYRLHRYNIKRQRIFIFEFKEINMIYILSAIAVFALDQLTKLWVKANIPLGGTAELISGVIGLRYVRNTGMAFSILSDKTAFLAVLSVLAVIALAVFIFKGKISRAEKLSLSLIAGGAAGNAVDRIFLGYVVDMFEIQLFNFAIFNVADIFIDTGAVLFCVFYLVRGAREDKINKSMTDKSNQEQSPDAEEHDDSQT